MKLSIVFKKAWAWFGKLSVLAKIIVVLLIAVIGWFASRTLFVSSTTSPSYITATAEKGSLIATVAESGNVVSDSQVNVPSPATGIIEEVYVQNGDVVSFGQNLFKVKATADPSQKASAYAAYLSAQNTLNSAKSKMNSLQSALFKANQAFVTDKGTSDPDTADPKYIQERADWLQAESDYNNQSGVIAGAEASLTKALIDLATVSDTIVTAPAAGTIANFSATLGSAVSASNVNASSTSNTTSTPVLVIGNFSQLLVKTQVSEVDVVKVKPGQKATITLDAFSDTTFAGTVKSVDSVGTSSSGVVTFSAYIAFIAPPSDVKSGMTASVAIQLDRRDDVVKVPSTAVVTTNGSTTVRILKNGKVSEVPVEVGLVSDSETEIISGVSEGDTVVTGTLNRSSNSSQTTSPFSGFGGGGRSLPAGRQGFGGGNVRIQR